jgi:hypothetical protein
VAAPDDLLPQGTDALACGPGRLVTRSPAGIGPRRFQGSPRFLGGPPCVHALGCPNPTRQGLATHRKRVLRGASEYSTPRSVDSECAGRGDQPRETESGSRRLGTSGRRHPRRLKWPGVEGPPGYRPTGSTMKGFRFCLLHVPSPLPSLPWREGRLRSGHNHPSAKDR